MLGVGGKEGGGRLSGGDRRRRGGVSLMRSCYIYYEYTVYEGTLRYVVLSPPRGESRMEQH